MFLEECKDFLLVVLVLIIGMILEYFIQFSLAFYGWSLRVSFVINGQLIGNRDGTALPPGDKKKYSHG